MVAWRFHGGLGYYGAFVMVLCCFGVLWCFLLLVWLVFNVFNGTFIVVLSCLGFL